MKNALLFPGQGSQAAGMLATLPERAATLQLLDSAESILGRDLSGLDSAFALMSTRNVQVALFLAGVASFRLAQAGSCRIDVVAGLSIGTYSAAVACGAATFADLLPIVDLRGRLMQEAYPEGYGMTAVSGLSFKRVEDMVEKIHNTAEPLYVANRYGYKQTILAGSVTSMKRVAEQAIQSGATSVKHLDVACPSHCPLLASVAMELKVALDEVAFRPPVCPYLSNRATRLVQSAEQVREDLASNAAYPIAWFDGMQLLSEQGVEVYIEAFPGQVLSRLAAADEDAHTTRWPMEVGWEKALSLAL